MNMTIRPANLTDIETLLLFGKELHFVEKEFEPALKYSEDEARERYTRQLQNPLALFLIASDKMQEAIGYLYAHAEKTEGSTDPECNLEVIYIKPEFRGRGLSSELIHACIDWAKENNIHKIKTEIFAKNTASKIAFEKQGFEQYLHIYSLDI